MSDPSVRLDVPALRDRVERWLSAGTPGAPAARDARVEYVSNWGGFVNASFRVKDAVRDVRLKLAREPDALEKLRRWRRLADVLHGFHAAPRMLGWVRVPDTAYEGPVFEWVDGTTPARLDGSLVSRVGGVLDSLARSRVLSPLLDAGRRRRTCRGVYLEILDRRFRENLILLESERPPFVSAGDLSWMRDEAEHLARRVAKDDAFDEAADMPMHGDLWRDNLILATDGRLVVLDWDDLSLGDAVFDWAMFLSSSRDALGPADASWLPPALAGRPRTRTRFDLYGRAILLDWVVDGLADWIDACALGEGAADMRARKEATFGSAREAYRAHFG